MNTYKLTICGIRRVLPLVKVGRKTSIANFSVLGDVELCDALSDAIAEKLRDYEFDYIVGPEVKSVPLIHGVAKRLGHKRYVVCRKSAKSYMRSPIKVLPLAHFPKHVTPLVINGPDADLISGKKIAIVDDVISTGVTIRMMKYLLKKIDAQVVVCVCALKQGEQFDEMSDLIYLGELPVFKESTS